MTRFVALVACAAPMVSAGASDPSLRGSHQVTAGAAKRVVASRGLQERFDHVGCFRDNTGDRVLGHQIWSNEMTLEMCHAHCTTKGGFYMGLEYGGNCFCSRKQELDYQRHTSPETPASCEISCTGDVNQKCGGNTSFDLYEIVTAPTSTDPEYMDCYADDKANRLMTDVLFDSTMTQALCRAHCKGVSALYYATQYGNECWCGKSSTFTDYEFHGPGVCHMPCAGDDSVACGGYNAFSLFRYIETTATRQANPTPEPSPQPTPEPTPEPQPTPEPTPEPQPTPEPTAEPQPTPAPTPEPSQEEKKSGSNDDVGVYPYGVTFSGDGTYYGETTNGNCAIRSPIPAMYDGMIPVALNAPQYGDSLLCGACIEGEGSGEGSGNDPIKGPFKAYVTDKCPECAEGALDFAQVGDGRWAVSWKFVPCPGSDEATFLFEGSNEYYWKLQPRGTRTPVKELSVAGNVGSRQDDNFFVVDKGVRFEGAQEVAMTTIGGKTMRQYVSLAQ